jgi:uncharacterized protein YktB (UPF0637 family)
MKLFDRKDFRVFDVTGFPERMHAIRERIQPRLHGIGESLSPTISALLDQPVFAHVAKHARRTVNPPDDTWVAFGLDKRGYKKDVHFKIAVSRNAVRLLFEVGPDYYDKAGWHRQWKRDFASLSDALGTATKLAWFSDEHDEEPAAEVGKLQTAALRDLGQALVRRRDGQLVFGRRLDENTVLGMSEAGFRKVVTQTFRPLTPLFLLHNQRVLA